MFHELATLLAIAVAICAIPLRPNTEPRCPTRNLTQEESGAFFKAFSSEQYRNYDDLVLSLKETLPSAYEKLKEEDVRFDLEVQKLGEEAEAFARKARKNQRYVLSAMIRGGVLTDEHYDMARILNVEYKTLSDDTKAQLKSSGCVTLPY